jgi:hypothetical protein
VDSNISSVTVRGSLRRIAPHCGTAMTKSANVTGFLSSPTWSTHRLPAIPISTSIPILLRHDTTECSSLDASVLPSTKVRQMNACWPRARAVMQYNSSPSTRIASNGNKIVVHQMTACICRRTSGILRLRPLWSIQCFAVPVRQQLPT